MQLQKNIKVGNKLNLFLFIYLLSIIVTFQTSAEINVDGKKGSLKYYAFQDGHPYLVGDIAERRRKTHPKSTIYHAKRFIGKSISEVGVTPDILVEEEGNEFLINSDKDNQLDYAIKLFNS